MYNDLVSTVINYSYFSVAKIRHYFESYIVCLWKIFNQEKNGNCCKSMNYEKPYIAPYGKFPAKVWKEQSVSLLSKGNLLSKGDFP